MAEESGMEVLAEVADKAAKPVDAIDYTPKAEGAEGEFLANGDLHPLKKHSEHIEKSEAIEQRELSNVTEAAHGVKEEEENALDGEFIKVEKEPGEENQAVIEQNMSNSTISRDLLETQEKLKIMELELEKMATALKLSETEKAQLKEEAEVANERLEERLKHFEELELNEKKLQDRIVETELKIKEAEEKYNSQLLALQEALVIQEAKHNELIDAKEVLDGLSIELESSRHKMQDLELELQSSTSDALKFEEISKESNSNAEIASQKALEFEKLLDLAKLSATEMESQMGSLQEELKGLYEKISENQQVEETLKNITAELTSVQEELEISTAQVVGLEKRVLSGESVIKELSEELSLRKASEEKMKEDILALENMCASSNNELQEKIVELGELEAKLREEVDLREMVEVNLKNQELQVLNLQEELLRVTEEKINMKATILEIDSNHSQVKDLCADLEGKLKLSDENFSKTDSLLAQALSNHSELEEKLKCLEEIYQESRNIATTATQRNLELEEQLKLLSNAAEEEKSQLSEIESQLLSAEQRNLELKEQLKLAETRSVNSDGEIKELQEKTSELSAMLKGVVEESTELKTQLKLYEEKITQLESSLDQSSVRNSELEMELKSIGEKCTQHEDQASTSHQRSLELEDLIKTSHSKSEDSQKRVGDLELLLAVAEQRTRELEEHLSIGESKTLDFKAESKRYSNKISQLEAEVEALKVKSTSLEIALQTANEKESGLMESLSLITEERGKHEYESISSAKKLSQVENLLGLLQNELKETKEKLFIVERDLKDTSIRESSIMEKLKAAEEELEQQGKVNEQASARSSELELLHKSLAKDSELKLQEAMQSFNVRDFEAKDLSEKLKSFEDQSRIYQEQAAEAAEKTESLKAELEECLTKLVSLENVVEELKNKALVAETRAGHFFSENEILAETNLKLNQELAAHESKVNELETLLSSLKVEKEATVVELASHTTRTISELTEQHSRASEQRDIEVKGLNEKLSAVETQLKYYEEQSKGVALAAETQKVELEEALLKVKDLEGIVEELQSKGDQFETENEGLTKANVKLNQELADYQTTITELQEKVNLILAEKEEIVEQLGSCKKTINDLTEQLATEGQRLQSQMSSVMEENNLLNETHQNSKRELQAVIFQMENKLNENKAREETLNTDYENLKAELEEKLVMKSHIAELEQQLMVAEAQLKAETESIKAVAAEKEAGLITQLEEHVNKLKERDVLDKQLVQLQKELHLAHSNITEQMESESKTDLEREAVLKHAQEELDGKNQQAALLQKQVEELQQKLQLADAKSKELVGAEVKSRDFSGNLATPPKKKSKRREVAPTQAVETSSAINFKFILGVALVSIILGVILGKRY